MRSSEKTTSSTVMGSPLWNFTSRRMVSSMAVAEVCVHEVARPGRHTPSTFAWSLSMSVSKAL